MKASYLSLWAINDKLQIEKLKDQLKELKDSGMQGVIFHPRNYPNIPEYLGKEYMNIVSHLILYAKELNMTFWIYDENGWPSGTANGKVLKANSSLNKQRLEIRKKEECNDLEIIRNYVIEDQEYCAVIIKEKGVRPTDLVAMNLFMEITYEGYRKGLCAEAWNYVKGFFSDEVSLPLAKERIYPSIPWGKEFIKAYNQRSNRNLLEDLQSVFYKIGDYKMIRVDYWETCAYLLANNYYRKFSTWCKQNNKRFIAHLRAEENLAFSISANGSIIQVLKEIDYPGIDALTRVTSNHYYPVAAVSASKQFHDGSTMCEAMGGCGWGVTPKDYDSYITWLSDCGINEYAFHIQQHVLDSHSMKDWPPSMPLHLSWKDGFREMLMRFQDKILNKEIEADTLIVSPTRAVMSAYEPWEVTVTNKHNGKNQPNTLATKISKEFEKLVEECFENNIKYHLTDELTLEENIKIKSGKVYIGNIGYSRIIIDPNCKFKKDFIIEQLKVFEYSKKLISNKIIEKSKNLLNIKQSHWKLESYENNLISLKDYEFVEGIAKITFRIDGIKDLSVISLDKLAEVKVNGYIVNLNSICENGYYKYRIDMAYLTNLSENNIVIQSTKEHYNPICFLSGHFKVKAKEYKKLDDEHVEIIDNYILRKDMEFDAANLIESGFIYNYKPIVLTKEIIFEEDVYNVNIGFDLFKAPMCKINIDGQEIYYFNNESSFKIEKISRGMHKVKCIVYPYTFNTFGPHNHIYGDIDCVSPGQYSGIKNFADLQEAPQNTYKNGMNVRIWGIGNMYIEEKEYED